MVVVHERDQRVTMLDILPDGTLAPTDFAVHVPGAAFAFDRLADARDQQRQFGTDRVVVDADRLHRTALDGIGRAHRVAQILDRDAHAGAFVADQPRRARSTGCRSSAYRPRLAPRSTKGMRLRSAKRCSWSSWYLAPHRQFVSGKATVRGQVVAITFQSAGNRSIGPPVVRKRQSQRSIRRDRPLRRVGSPREPDQDHDQRQRTATPTAGTGRSTPADTPARPSAA